MVDRSVRFLGIAVVAGPLILLVGIPLVATFLEWVSGVPEAFLVEILPERASTS